MGKMAQSELSWHCCSLSWHRGGPMCLLCAWWTPRYLKAFGSDAPSPRKPSWLPPLSAPDLHTLIRAFPWCPYCLLLPCRTTLQASQDSPTWPYCAKPQRGWDVCPASHSWEVAEPSTLTDWSPVLCPWAVQPSGQRGEEGWEAAPAPGVGPWAGDYTCDIVFKVPLDSE